MNRKLYVGNLSFQTTEADLEGLFARSGNVASVMLVRDRETGRARGFGFVEMATEDGAKQAIESLNSTMFGGRNLTVNEARPQVSRVDAYEGRRPSRRSEPRW